MKVGDSSDRYRDLEAVVISAAFGYDGNNLVCTITTPKNLGCWQSIFVQENDVTQLSLSLSTKQAAETTHCHSVIEIQQAYIGTYWCDNNINNNINNNNNNEKKNNYYYYLIIIIPLLLSLYYIYMCKAIIINVEMSIECQIN